MHSEFHISDDVPLIIRKLAEVSAAAILPHFRAPLDVENKLLDPSIPADEQADFDPVTIADKEAERVMREEIFRHYPNHGIIGEEFGRDRPDAEYVWILDPIDGTRAFVSGLPLWGTLIALCRNGTPILGAMVQPYLNELHVGDGTQSVMTKVNFPKSSEKPVQLSTRDTSNLRKATVFTTDPALFDDAEEVAYRNVEKRTQLHRYGLDCYGYAMVASGHCELVIEAGLQVYDIAALIPLIESAGGQVTDWEGRGLGDLSKRTDRLRVVAAANQSILDETLAILAMK